MEKKRKKIFTLENVTSKQVPLSSESQKQFDEQAVKFEYQDCLEVKANNTYSSMGTTKNSNPRSYNLEFTLPGKKPGRDMDMAMV